MALNDKQRRFIHEYLIDMNATEAAKRSGYSDKTARSQGSRLLTNADILAEIKRLQSVQTSTAGKTREEIIENLDSVINLFIVSGKLTGNALKAIEILNKMKGWNEPDKAIITHKGLSINYVKPKDEGSND